MKTEIGTIQSSRIGKNIDGQNDVLLHNTQLTQDDDVQTVEQMQMPGIQYNPPVGSKGFVGYVSSLWKFFKGIFDLVGRVSLNPGEIIIYSSSGGSVQASLKFLSDGSALLTVPAGLTVEGNSQFNGTIDSTGNISSEADMISDSSATAISALNHPHIGDLGFNTGAPVPVGGGVAPPGSVPTYNSGTNTADLKNMDLDNVGTISTTLGNHTHNQPADAGGDAESPTNIPN